MNLIKIYFEHMYIPLVLQIKVPQSKYSTILQMIAA